MTNESMYRFDCAVTFTGLDPASLSPFAAAQPTLALSEWISLDLAKQPFDNRANVATLPAMGSLC